MRDTPKTISAKTGALGQVVSSSICLFHVATEVMTHVSVSVFALFSKERGEITTHQNECVRL